MTEGPDFTSRVHGYDPGEVDEAIEARDRRIAALEREATKLSRMMVDQEQRLRQAEQRGWISSKALGPVSRRLEEAQAQARSRALRLRDKAFMDAARFADRVVELARLQDELGVQFTELARRAGIPLDSDPAGSRPRPGPRPQSADPLDSDPLDPGARARQGWRGFAGAGGGALRDAPEDGLYRGAVELEIGPLTDFAQLTGVEDAIGAVQGVARVEVAGFAGGRAQFMVTLGEPAPLVEELRVRIPLRFEVASQGADWLELKVLTSGSGADSEAA